MFTELFRKQAAFGLLALAFFIASGVFEDYFWPCWLVGLTFLVLAGTLPKFLHKL